VVMLSSTRGGSPFPTCPGRGWTSTTTEGISGGTLPSPPFVVVDCAGVSETPPFFAGGYGGSVPPLCISSGPLVRGGGGGGGRVWQSPPVEASLNFLFFVSFLCFGKLFFELNQNTFQKHFLVIQTSF
jgi:hypothetical protein